MKRFSFSSLRFRLLLLVLLASIPAMLLTVNHAIEDRNAATTRIQGETVQLTQLTVANQEQWVESARQLLITLGNMPAVRNRNSTECSEFMGQIHKNYPHYANLFADTPDGDEFCSAIPIKQPVNAAQRVWFKRAVSNREFAIGDYQIGPVSGLPVIVMAYPVYDENGSLQAVVSASLDLAWLNEQAAKMQLSPGATFRIIDQKGTILVRNPDPQKWVGRDVSEVGIIKTQLSQHEGTTETEGVDGVRRFFAFAPVHSGTAETGLFVSYGIPASIAVTKINSILVRDLTGLSIPIFLMLVIAWFVSDAFVMSHVNTLIKATKRLGTGDLSVRTGLKYDKGEVGELARAFDGMVGSLQEKEAQRRQAEDALRKNEAMLNETQHLTKVGGWEYVVENSKNTWTDEVYRIYGVSPQDYDPNKITQDIQFYSPEGREIIERAFKYAVEEGESYDLELKFMNACGENMWIRTIGRPERKDGKVVRVYGNIMDITDRKNAEEELKKHREHLEELVKERTEQLNLKNEELERFNKLFVGRELRMIELKKQIAELKKQIGELNKKIGSTENTKGT